MLEDTEDLAKRQYPTQRERGGTQGPGSADDATGAMTGEFTAREQEEAQGASQGVVAGTAEADERAVGGVAAAFDEDGQA